MASDSATGFIKRNRPPRVNISYEDPYDSEKMVELPFVMGVFSDLSGNASEVEKEPLTERDFTDVTAGTLDAYMASIQPGLSFTVKRVIQHLFRAGPQHHPSIAVTGDGPCWPGAREKPGCGKNSWDNQGCDDDHSFAAKPIAAKD